MIDHLDRRIHARFGRILPVRRLRDDGRQLGQRPLGAFIGLGLRSVVDVHVRPDREGLGEATLQRLLRVDAGRALSFRDESHKPLTGALDGFENAGGRALTDLHLRCLLG